MRVNWTTASSLVLRPVFLLLLLWGAAVIGAAIRRRIPEGPVKRILEHPAPLVPRTDVEQRDWWPFVAWLAAAVVIWAMFWPLLHH